MPDPNEILKLPTEQDKAVNAARERRDYLANNFGDIMSRKAYDPVYETRTDSYNPNSTTDLNKNFDRYYSHPSFNKLGYNPWTDNESLYNEKSSGLGDVWRATKSAGKLAVTGALSPIRSYADLLTGDILLPDYKSAEEMKYLNTVGMSTRGGVSGFASNLITNSGYTIGLIGELALETAAIGLATGGTGLPAIASKLGKFAKDFGEYAKAAKDIGKTVSTLDNYSAAKGAWETIRKGATKVAEFANPLENTVEALRTIKNSENLTNLAKFSTTAGAFYRDVQMANLTLAESKMEGASAEKDLEEKLVGEYIEKHDGNEPGYDDLIAIKQAASDAGVKTLAWNIPTIFLTNKITFDPLFKSLSLPSEYALRNGTRFVEKEGEGLVKSTFVNRITNSLKPKNLATLPIRYFKENFSEGIQETAQEIISGTAKDYYKGLYDSASKHGLDYANGEYRGDGVWDVLSKNVADQFSGKGFETFTSGFLMGGLLRVAGAPLAAAKMGVSEYRRTKSEYADKTLGALNEIYKDPLRYFAPGIINYANAGEAVSGQSASEQAGDVKDWYDLENSNLISNVVTALDTKTYDIFLKKLNNIKTMEPQAIKDAYGLDGEEVLSKIDKILGRAEQVKKNYKKWNERFPNPFNVRAYKEGTEDYNKQAIGFSAWENAKKVAIFNETSLGRNANRITNITDNILQNEEFAKVSPNSISVLFSPHDLNNELRLLNNEIEVLEGVDIPANRQSILQKKTRYDKLGKFQEALKGYYFTQKLEGLGVEDKHKAVYEAQLKESKKTTLSQFKKSYVDYLKTLQTLEGNTVSLNELELDRSFEGLLDLHDLKQDNAFYTKAVDILSNPKGFVDQYKRLNTVFTDLYNTRQETFKKGVDFVQSKIEDNTILTALHTKGFVLSPDNAEKLLKDKELPKEFYDMNAKQVVDDRDRFRYEEFKAIIDNYTEATKTEAVEPESVKTETKEEATKTKQEVKPELSLDIQKKFDEVKNGEDLTTLEEELAELMTSIHIEDRVRRGLTSKNINDKVVEKRKTLSNEVLLSNLNKGDLVQMVDPDYGIMMVIRKTKNNVMLEKVKDKSIRVTVEEGNLKNSIKFKYADVMKDDIKVEATKNELEKTKQNVASQDKITKNAELVKELVEEGIKDKVGARKDWLENLGCN